jgi:hypothetical protein
VTRHIYEIKVIGSFGPATHEAFADMVVEVEPTITVLSANLDQRGLHAVLDRVRALGLELVEITQAPPSSRSRSGGGSMSSSQRQDAVERASSSAWSDRGPGRVRAVASIRKSLNVRSPQTTGDDDPIGCVCVPPPGQSDQHQNWFVRQRG